MPQQQTVEQIVSSSPELGGQDRATEMIARILGEDWHKIITGQEITGEPSLILPILQVFNTVVLVIVALLIVYIAIHAFIGSAHDATPLGKRFHTIWVPVRSVLSITFLAPIPWATSLNVIQGIVLLFVGYSIQFANMATEAGVEYITENRGQVIVSPPSGLKQEAHDIAETALHNYLIQYNYALFQGEDVDVGYEKIVITPDYSLAEREYDFSGMTQYDAFRKQQSIHAEEAEQNNIIYAFNAPVSLSDDTMGEIVIDCEALNSFMCVAKQQYTETLLENMRLTAHGNASLLVPEDSPVETATVPLAGTINNAINQYVDNMYNANAEFITRATGGLQDELDLFSDRLNSEGFVMLGSYFWTITRFNMAMQDRIDSRTIAVDYNEERLKQQAFSEFNQIETILNVGASYFRETTFSRDIARLGVEHTETDQTIVNRVRNAADSAFAGAVEYYVNSITADNPLVSLSSAGNYIVMSGVALFGGLGMIATLPGIGNAAAGILVLIVPPVFALGIALAYYLPAIPFLVWVVAVFGWILMVLEALVAAPVWAAMHASPDGEGVAGDKGAKGYMLFAQVLFKPILMVVGFFFAILLLHVIPFFGQMFTVFFYGQAGGNPVNIFSALVGIFICTIIIIMLVHKAFSLVYYLPEALPRWIGETTGALGEGKDTERGSRAVMAGAYVGGQAARGGGTAIQSQAHEWKKQDDKKEEEGRKSNKGKGLESDLSPGQTGGADARDAEYSNMMRDTSNE